MYIHEYFICKLNIIKIEMNYEFYGCNKMREIISFEIEFARQVIDLIKIAKYTYASIFILNVMKGLIYYDKSTFLFSFHFKLNDINA